MDDLFAQLGRIGVVPVVAIETAADAPALGRALLAGGLPCAEITFRTPAAAEAIRLMGEAAPELLLGAGTVLTPAQVETAVNAGARFIVTPGFDAAVVDACQAMDVPVIPGVMTPTEINMALNRGLSVLKFFPAEAAGGVATLKAISGPYGDVRFIPTGRISPQNLAEYLRQPFVLACGGSWLVKKALIAAQEFEAITNLAAAVRQVAQIDGGG